MATKITFITGKGGVGKSMIALALANAKAARTQAKGAKTLLAEIGDQSFFEAFFQGGSKGLDTNASKPATFHLGKVQYQPQEIFPGLDLSVWSGAECLKEYARHLLKFESLYRIFFENAVMKTFLDVAPALPELAIMGKVTSGPRNHGPPFNYDHLVLDSYATGHFMALLRAPKAMAETIQFGPMGEQSRSIDGVLKDSRICDYIIVTLPEELPVKECLEMYSELNQELKFPPKIVLNKSYLTAEEHASLSDLRRDRPDLSTFCEYLDYQWQQRNSAIKLLENVVPQDRIFEMPYVYSNDPANMMQTMTKNLLTMSGLYS